jgi:L-fuconolactonase
MAAWRGEMAKLATRSNLCCKLSGLLTECPPGASLDAVAQAIAALLDLFGPERLLWGSDWPVLTLASSYQDWFRFARDAVAAWQPEAVAAIFGGNATRIYRPSRA